ncbi:MAG: type II secretion system F family protein [Peptococcales bacterium]|jgi:tight adherence protein B
MIIAIALFSFLTILLLILGCYQLLTGKKKVILTRLRKFTRTPGQVIIDEHIKAREEFTLQNILRILGKVFETRSYTKKVENELLKADIPMRGSEYIVFNIFVIILCGSVGFILGGLGTLIVLGTLGFIGPSLFVKSKKQARFEKLNLEIGDCLTVMSNSLRAGYSFQQAMELVSKEMGGPLAMEFGKTLREINFGTPTEQALANMASRIESDDLDLMITAVLIQRQIGGNLAEILDNISNTLRERIRIKGEIKTLTAQGRISGLVIGLMPPILFAILLVINPGYIGEMLAKPIGIYMLIAGVFSQIVGFIFIRKIVNIEV